MTKAPIFVLIQGLNYSRYVGNTRTNFITVDIPLSRREVENFRLHPQRFIDWCNGPEAA